MRLTLTNLILMVLQRPENPPLSPHKVTQHPRTFSPSGTLRTLPAALRPLEYRTIGPIPPLDALFNRHTEECVVFSASDVGAILCWIQGPFRRIHERGPGI